MKTRVRLEQTILSESAHRHLNEYAFSASAAGVNLLALALPAEAKIVYTPTNVKIASGYNLDLNGDGGTDFTITLKRGAKSGCSQYAALNETAVPHNGAEADQNGALALYQGDRIGPGDSFGQGRELMAALRVHKTIRPPFCTSRRYGNWQETDNRYLGFKFKIHGEFHYGWARLTVHIIHVGGIHLLNATITGYAYETIPGKALKAGQTHGRAGYSVRPDPAHLDAVPTAAQPGSLGMLALGSQAIRFWRREKSDVSARH